MPRKNGDLGVLMKPEGSVKISVDNGSRRVDQVINGDWVSLKTLPEAGLPKGYYQLSEATNPAKNVHPQSFGSQVLHVDQKHVYQFGPKGIVQHDRKIFDQALDGKEPVVGKCYEVSYSRGVGKVKAELTQEQGAKLQAKKAHTL
ncbi:TraB protein [Stutzerimonas stutzeri B1SMN1]|nr:TraB protein [Stutzerimonas stutzeri B1SMN1]